MMENHQQDLIAEISLMKESPRGINVKISQYMKNRRKNIGSN